MSTVDLNAPIELEQREVVGKRLAVLRADGKVPAVIHNHGQDSLHVMGPQIELEKIYDAAGKHHPLQLKVGSQEFLALIKDAHLHPVKRHIDHLVFQAIRQDEAVEAEVPIHIEGEIPAEKVGLEIMHQLDHVEVEALPKDLPDEFVIDASVLAEIGDKVTVGDLKVPEGVTIVTDAGQPIVTVVEPRAEEVFEKPEAEATEEEEGAEGEEGESAEGEGGEAAPEGGDNEGPAAAPEKKE